MTKITDERLAEMLAVLDLPIGAAVVKGGDLADLRSILTELQTLRAQGGVCVKPLEWVRVTEPPTCHGGEPKRYWKASDALGGWVWVTVHSEDFDGEASWGGEKYPSSAAAMSAAEGHRRDRILSSLEASPAPVSDALQAMQVRAEAAERERDEAYNRGYSARDEVVSACRCRAEAAEARVKEMEEALRSAASILDGELGASWGERNEADFHIITDALTGGSNG